MCPELFLTSCGNNSWWIRALLGFTLDFSGGFCYTFGIKSIICHRQRLWNVSSARPPGARSSCSNWAPSSSPSWRLSSPSSPLCCGPTAPSTCPTWVYTSGNLSVLFSFIYTHNKPDSHLLFACPFLGVALQHLLPTSDCFVLPGVKSVWFHFIIQYLSKCKK